MTYALMQNSAGAFVAPDDAAFKAAAAGADWSKTFYQILTNQPGKDSWPITGATFIMMQLKQDKPQQAAATGPMPTATRWPTIWTMCRCPKASNR